MVAVVEKIQVGASFALPVFSGVPLVSLSPCAQFGLVFP